MNTAPIGYGRLSLTDVRVSGQTKDAGFATELRAADSNIANPPFATPRLDPTANRNSRADGVQRDSDISFLQTLQASRAIATAASSDAPTDDPPMFFPPDFPPEMTQTLTDFLNHSNLSSQEKDAVWATTVVSVDLMKHGPAEFRQRLTGGTASGSTDFDPIKVLANVVKALSSNGHPGVAMAMQDYLQHLDAGPS